MNENLNGFVFRRVSKILNSPKIRQCKQKKLSITKNKKTNEETKNNDCKAIKKRCVNKNLNGFVFKVGKKIENKAKKFNDKNYVLETNKTQVKDELITNKPLNTKDRIAKDFNEKKENLVTPLKKTILSKIKEPTPFRFDKNDFLDIKTPKKSIFYNESFLINSRNKKRPSIFDKNITTKNDAKFAIEEDEIENLYNKDINCNNTNKNKINENIIFENIINENKINEDDVETDKTTEEISKSVKYVIDSILKNMKISLSNDAVKKYKYVNLNKKIEQDFIKYIQEYKNEIENIKNEIEKWKRIKENVLFENDYFYEPKKYEISEYKINEECERKRKIENEYEKIKTYDENAIKYKNKIKKDIENVNTQIKEIKSKIYSKMESRSKMDPVTLCKAMSRL